MPKQVKHRSEIKWNTLRVSLSILKRNHIDTGCVSHFYAFFKHKNRFVYCLNFSHWVCYVCLLRLLFSFSPVILSPFLSHSCLLFLWYVVKFSSNERKNCRFSLAWECDVCVWRFGDDLRLYGASSNRYTSQPKIGFFLTKWHWHEAKRLGLGRKSNQITYFSLQYDIWEASARENLNTQIIKWVGCD